MQALVTSCGLRLGALVLVARATVYPLEPSWTSYRDLYYPRLP
jgi:hypothetical protein